MTIRTDVDVKNIVLFYIMHHVVRILCDVFVLPINCIMCNHVSLICYMFIIVE